ncbi:ribonuclease HII [Candidatus Hepatobacter penaei]|uniref:ribonuclease HII n=1 Tax=Candidatus Hepatobacter penaei TaxID=1274402 RepID=UPI0004F35963|nr:ribonuclease HII [Candidatus Hepatobacter penaei]
MAGCDEVGRGPLAGPVVAAAVVLTRAFYDTPLIHRLVDSKKLSERKRTAVAHALHQASHTTPPLLHYAMHHISAPHIDRINILNASLLAMERAVKALHPAPPLIFVDGKHTLPHTPSLALTRGDACHVAIAAASIIAKVARDAWMAHLDACYPGYGFAKHKGYGTQAHLEALKHLGACPEHRRSFAPVSLYTQQA